MTLLADGLDPATGFPRNGAFTHVSLIGAGACAVVVGVAVLARHGQRAANAVIDTAGARSMVRD